MTPEEYFGKECAQSVRNLFFLVMKSNVEKKIKLSESLHEEADKQTSDNLRIILVRIAKQIESMGV